MSTVGTKVTALRGTAINLGDAADEFLGTHRVANDNTRRTYTSAIDRVLAEDYIRAGEGCGCSGSTRRRDGSADRVGCGCRGCVAAA